MNDFMKQLCQERGILNAKIDAIIVFLGEPFVETSLEDLALLEQKLVALKRLQEVVTKQIDLNTVKTALPHN
jgi:hypothetical protein